MSESTDFEAEKATLGGMLLSSAAVGEVLETVRSQDFAHPRHILLFERIVQLYGEGAPHDPVAVASSLLASGDIARSGGAPYLYELVGSVPAAANAAYYAQRVADTALLRRFQTVAARIGQMARGATVDDAQSLIAAAYTELDTVLTDRDTAWEPVDEVIERVLEEIADPQQEPGYQSGLADVDEMYRGVPPGGVDIVAARASTGKSLAAGEFIRANTLRRGVDTLLFTLEMSSDQYIKRLISAEAKVSLDKLTNPHAAPLTEFEWAKIQQAYPLIRDGNLRIIDDSDIGLAEVARHVREGVRRGLKFVVIDFLQLMNFPAGVEREDVAVGMNAYGLKKLARRADVRILALAQLNRESTRRAGGVPWLSDIGGSKKVEEAATNVILLDRPEQRDINDRPGEADWIVAKQRDGRTGAVPVSFQGHYARFESMGRH